MAPRDLQAARAILDAEARAISNLRERLDAGFPAAVAAVAACRGRVVTTGMGKSGHLAQRLSAIFASVGIPSLYLHPAEAAHGDLGRVASGDVVIALSSSGETEELVRLLPGLERLGASLIALTGRGDSALARAADHVLDLRMPEDDGPLGTVPTASSAALHALGDALVAEVLAVRSATTADWAHLHPGGALGRAAARVSELMRKGDAVPRVLAEAKLSEAIAVMTRTPGRPGCALAVDPVGRLAGIFTDGDLRRLIERGALDLSASLRGAMTANPAAVAPELRVLEAARVLRERGIDQLAVVDADGRPVGLLDIQDLLAARFIA